ncbi:hypothetical protein Q3A68_22035 [Mucilaginibacter sp. BT774]|nr:hypothetical protein [Mucilaginibacter sp. BT774]
MPDFTTALSATKAEVKKKIDRLNRPGMENEFNKLVSLTNFLAELEQIERSINQLKILKA